MKSGHRARSVPWCPGHRRRLGGGTSAAAARKGVSCLGHGAQDLLPGAVPFPEG